jgi:hemoglobin/transferrin/lactoferrin receptor protein
MRRDLKQTLVTAIGAAALTMALGGAAFAQNSEATAVDEIVVVGVLTDIELDREDIELTQANDLADLFRSEPSVTVGGSLGIAQKIYVRGLEDSLLNVTVDGAPQRGTLFHHIGRVSLEPELLETVDVQTGAGEATAGFGAVGGAIRFRTRDPVSLLEGDRDFGAMARLGWFSNDGEKYSLTGYGRLFGDFGLMASYVSADRGAYEDGDGNEIRGSAAEQELFFVKAGGDLGGGHRLSLSYEQREETGEFGQRPNWPALATDRLFPGEARRRTFTANYGYDLNDWLSLEATAYSTETRFTQNRYDRWGLYGSEILSQGGDLRLTARHGDHEIIGGVEYRADEVVSEYLGDPAVWGPWAWNPAIGRFKESGELFGAYLQDHWQATDRLLVSAGVRYDAYDLSLDTYGGGVDSDGFSFNLGADYELTNELTLNIGWAEAFRGKEIGDGFTLETRPNRLSLSPTLQPERVDNFEAGLSWTRDGFTASAVYFDMTIDDVVLDQLGSGPAPQAPNYYENVGEFTSDGFELKAGYDGGVWGVDAFFTHYDSRLNGRVIEGYEHIALGNSMGDSWNVTGRWSPLETLDLQASVTVVQDLDDIEVLFREAELGFINGTRFIDKPGYSVVDVFGRWRPWSNDRVEVLAGVYNLFDEQYRSHASVADYSGIPGYGIVRGIPEAGRNIRLTLALKY